MDDAPRTLVERERKYEVAGSVAPPPFAGVPASELHTSELHTSYYDTEDRALLRHSIALRRREGGLDAGWHVKRPHGRFRREEQAPLSGEPPETLLGPLRGIIRDRPLSVIAVINNRRTTVAIRDEDGAEIAEFADDHVEASDPASGVAQLWREWEVELVAGPDSDDEAEQVLDALGESLLEAGATPSAWGSKLQRTLGRNDEAVERTPRVAGEFALAVLASLTESLLAADAAIRSGEDGGVHDMRTTARRARAALAIFRPMLDAAVTEPIREGLTRLIRALEPARDAEVRQARSEELLADPTHAGFPGEVRSRLVAETSRSQDAALADIVAYLNSTDYYGLLDELDSVVARPPVSGAFGAAPRKAFRPVLVHEAKRAAKGIRRMRNDNLPSIHEARKAVRRFRLAAEALTEPPAEIFGARWAKLAAEASDLQDSMGDHRDAVLFVTHLESVARDATSAGENAAFYGMLAQEEKARADGLLSQVGDSAPRFRKAARAL